MKITGNAVIAQGGGPTAVINQSLVGAVLEMQQHSEITGIYGALHGVKGIIDEDFIDLSFETPGNLEAVANTPCSALFSTRDKPNAEYCEQIFKVFKKYNIRYFFYIGGNDSSDTVRIVNEYAEKEDYDFRAFHIPKTIDNDLELNDHTPGYGSAAKFVAEAFMGANLETKALPGIYIGVVMGRHAGFLTAAAALGRTLPDDGPHLVYMPERAFDIDEFLKDVKVVYERLGRCLIAVSEGIIDKEGTLIAAKLKENVTRDAHGNIELAGGELGEMLSKKIKETLHISRVRADTFGYLQRSFAGTVSVTDQIEAREAGAKAVIYGVSGHYKSGSIIIKRVGDYDVAYELTDLANIAAKTRHMPDSYITKEGNQVTGAFMKYGFPLLGSTFKKTATLKAQKVDKIK
ncbi:6-phosphofructokinase [endosymbiont 'TC1' of Trimyema compressum]|uniref:6-phosphofructokinase n=1 Tax=endosymbiont 'TC1' of Trimyema compressum TaxID=243899 RepID=UPI0007F07D26|nr:6-phosphofructokinase [endosymbiont 'TC1' of Trimyema compressum]AMP20991.1 6-phosphofructokinase [endosymbiont 'TC1' of Trimyema compressum]